ncbi:DUF2513 domain-containing protein [Phenylobacterium conjunctum]|uniref:DUF2513 domain-containing protein n=1 Tax=Phenylobacterium conjunctum TaxID=1298959 RepID=A0ABW3SXS9_9CAUL
MIHLNPRGVVAMKRDMELVAKLVEVIEAKDSLRPEPISVDGYEEWIVQRHLEALSHEGMVDAIISRTLDELHPTVFVRDLTWAGHDFAATLKSPAWQEVKAKLTPVEMMTASFKVLSDIGAEAVKAYLLKKLGLGS